MEERGGEGRGERVEARGGKETCMVGEGREGNEHGMGLRVVGSGGESVW